jgi:hypothetical protein
MPLVKLILFLYFITKIVNFNQIIIANNFIIAIVTITEFILLLFF